MDEFKKDEILEGEDVVAEAEVTASEEPEENVEEAVEEIAEEKSELDAELEELRDMFQRELDAAKENSNVEMLIQELDEIGRELIQEEAENDLPACECCGENPCSPLYGEGYPYCDSCREAMKRYPLRFSGILALLVSITLFAVTVYLSSTSALDSSISAADCIVQFESGNLYSALQSSYSYLSSADESSVSMKIVKKTIDAYVNTGYYSDAASLIETYFSETALKMPWNKKYQNIIHESTVLEETYYAVSDVIDPVAKGEKYDYNEIMAALDELKTINPTETGASKTVTKYNDIFIEYYKYVVMSVNKQSLNDQLAQLKKIDEIGEGFEWVYLSNLCGIAARAGDLATVEAAFEKAISLNKEDMNAYVAKASYYRFCETPDPDKILEICAEAAVNANGDTSYKQYEAIAYLMKGEGTLALEAISEAITSGYTVQSCNLYALCGLYTGDESIYNQMKELLSSSGYEISELVTMYKDKKISLDKILADNGGDI